MRTIDENKMVSIEAGDAGTVLACIGCAAAIGVAIACIHEVIAMLLTPGANDLVVQYGTGTAALCLLCYYGISE